MPTPKHWETQVFRLRPYAERCSCGHLIFPARDLCPKCGRDVLPDFCKKTAEGKLTSLDRQISVGKVPENVVFMSGSPEKNEG